MLNWFFKFSALFELEPPVSPPKALLLCPVNDAILCLERKSVLRLERCWVVGSCQHLQLIRVDRVISSKPHELFACLCQSCLCRLLLVVTWEPSGAGWTIDGLLRLKMSLVDADVSRLISAVCCSIMAQAEVGVLLAVVIRTLPASHTLKQTSTMRIKDKGLHFQRWSGDNVNISLFPCILTWVKTEMLSFKARLLSWSENGNSLDSCQDKTRGDVSHFAGVLW